MCGSGWGGGGGVICEYGWCNEVELKNGILVEQK